MSFRLECYICHKQIPRNEYTPHVASCLTSHATKHDEFGEYHSSHYHNSDKDNSQGNDTTYTAPPATPRETSTKSSSPAVAHGPLNAFDLWLKNPMRNFPEYTQIDGHNRANSYSEEKKFIRAAWDLRETSKAEVAKIVERFQGFSVNERNDCLELVRKTPIFPGFVAYVYTHLVKCPPHRWLRYVDWSYHISDLKKTVQGWKEEGDVMSILGCELRKKRLLHILSNAKIPPSKHKCNPALVNEAAMLDCDVLNLAAVAALCITEPQKKQSLFQLGRDVQAESLIELYDSLLEVNLQVAHDLEEECRRYFFNALIKFSKASGYCPRGVYLTSEAINTRNLVRHGQGGFGEVFKGTIGPRLIAVKVLKRGEVGLPEYRKQLCKEAIVWRHLRHPNCLPLYGVCCEMPSVGNMNVALVSPWMNRGTLANYLKEKPKANRTRLILDVARGLDYLHSMKPHVAHRDIKPENILITRKGHACLADFGLVSVFDTDEDFRTAPSKLNVCGTLPYMAPELFGAKDKHARRKLNKRACDMYALGCTIYVVYTNDSHVRELYSHLRSDQLPANIPTDMWSFVQNLCAANPLKRLTAEMAVGWMEEKARQDGTDMTPAPFEEEWEWKAFSGAGDQGLWSVANCK